MWKFWNFPVQIQKIPGPKRFTCRLFQIIWSQNFHHRDNQHTVSPPQSRVIWGMFPMLSATLSTLSMKHVLKSLPTSPFVLYDVHYTGTSAGFFRLALMHTWNSAELNGHLNMMHSLSCCATTAKAAESTRLKKVS
jgi:hypothetical protein